MHREFRKLLDKAVGHSEFVIAVNADIREFSSFSQKMDSMEVAMFIKRIYTKLIDEYFVNASFYKPTGDGLLVIIPYSEEDLSEVLNDTIAHCLKLQVDFSSFCIGDQMINFHVPSRIGIGLSRGSACRLTSEGKILDYSGRVLNLASRLMNVARPNGVVFDSNFGIELLPGESIDLFDKDSIYINGIAEREPIDIYYTKEYTRISPLLKHPIEDIKWITLEHSRTIRQLKESVRHLYRLDSKPIDPNQIKVQISHDKRVRGKRLKDQLTHHDFSNFEYVLEAEAPIIILRYDVLVGILAKEGLPGNESIKIRIMYPEYPQK